jgi:hypothetical protein
MRAFARFLVLVVGFGAPFSLPAQSFVDPSVFDADSASSAASAESGHDHPVKDMTLGNFFEGWNEEWVHRHRYTPDMALLRVTTNFLEREFRIDYVRTDVANIPRQDSQEQAIALMAYGLSRRLMLEVVTNYQWNNPAPHGVPVNGGAGSLVARFQLVDTATQSYSFQFRANSPNKGLGATQTSLQYVLAGWQDMHAIVPALGRFGLFGSFTYEALLGPRKAGAATNDVSYDISFAKTWTSPDTKVFGNFTTFFETFATTLLDGATAGKTTVSVTPGIRFWFIPKNSFTVGVDFPASHAPTFHTVFRTNYILNF